MKSGDVIQWKLFMGFGMEPTTHRGIILECRTGGPGLLSEGEITYKVLHFDGKILSLKSGMEIALERINGP